MSMSADAKKDFRPVHNLFLGILGSLWFILPAVLLQGWILKVLWNWYLPALGAPRLTYIAGTGIIIIFSFLTSHASRPDPRPLSKRLASQVEASFFTPFVFLFLGFVVHHFS